jgi:hypothetical protein
VQFAPGEEIPMTDESTTPPSGPPRPRRRRPPVPEVPGVGTPVDAAGGIPAEGAASAAAPAQPAGLPAVEVLRGAVGGIRARDVHVRNGIVGGMAGDHASVEMGLVGGIAAREASVSQGIVRAVAAQEVRIEQSFVRTIVANRVQAGPTTAIAFVVARRVDGDARILFDWRGALALAAVFGALAAVFRLRRR